MSQPICPRCRATPAAAVDVGEGVFACSCGAFVVDGAARKKLTSWMRIDEGLYQQLLREGGKGPSCAFCQQRLRTFSLRGVTVDGCDVCHSLLLDRGELQRLTGLQEPTPPPKPESATVATVATATATASPPSPSDASLGRVYVDAETAVRNFLGEVPWVQVKQERQFAEAMLGVEFSNRYVLQVSLGAGHCRREHSGVGEQIVQLFTGGLLRSTYVIEDPRSNPCLTLERSFQKLVLSKLVVRLYEGRALGSVEKSFAVTSTYSLKDPTGREFATLQRPLLSLWQWKLLGKDGEERGAIAKQWSGLRSEYFTDGDDFGVDFAAEGDRERDVVRPWSWEERAIITAAVIAIDLDHFERKGGGNTSMFDLLR